MNKNINSIRTIFFFAINGVACTLIHYLILFILIEIVKTNSAAVSSLVASLIASSISFLGNKKIVFCSQSNSLLLEASRFAVLYLLLAIFHSVFLLIWTDLLELDYRHGFLLALIVQIAVGYCGNKYYVFNQ